MKKNYKRYWALLKESAEGKITLVFELEKYESFKELSKDVNLWRQGFSREKYKDFLFQTKNPTFRLGFEEVLVEDGKALNLTVILYNDATLSSANPRIQL